MYRVNQVLLCLVSSLVLVSVIGRRTRILKGDEVLPGQFTYTVAIFASDRFICTGGIIGERWILSAAHCATEPKAGDPFRNDSFSIVAGTHDFARETDPNGFEIPVEAIYIPRDYKLAIRRADIAVFKLARALHLQKYCLQRLSLPTDKKNPDFYKVGTHALVTGFGASYVVQITVNGTSKELSKFAVDGKLRSAEVKIASNDEFARIPDVGYDLGEDHLLARMTKSSDDGYGMCYGDSGSPLVYDSKIVIGVAVEMFDLCDERVYPSMYIKVAHYLDFVRDAVDDRVTEDVRVRRYA